jgi:hypothetical protein
MYKDGVPSDFIINFVCLLDSEFVYIFCIIFVCFLDTYKNVLAGWYLSGY